MADFCRHVAALLHGATTRCVIVLDGVEKLARLHANTLQVFCRLSELVRYAASLFWQTGCNVTVVLISNLVWEKLRGAAGGMEPLLIHFPPYSKEEVCPAVIIPFFFFCSLPLFLPGLCNG